MNGDRHKLLEKNGIKTMGDFLSFYDRSPEDLRKVWYCFFICSLICSCCDNLSNITLCRFWERFLTKIGKQSLVTLRNALQDQEFTLVAYKRGMGLTNIRHFLKAMAVVTLRGHAQSNQALCCEVSMVWSLFSNWIVPIMPSWFGVERC